jgi:hypothetical protein
VLFRVLKQPKVAPAVLQAWLFKRDPPGWAQAIEGLPSVRTRQFDLPVNPAVKPRAFPLLVTATPLAAPDGESKLCSPIAHEPLTICPSYVRRL